MRISRARVEVMDVQKKTSIPQYEPRIVVNQVSGAIRWPNPNCNIYGNLFDFSGTWIEFTVLPFNRFYSNYGLLATESPVSMQPKIELNEVQGAQRVRHSTNVNCTWSGFSAIIAWDRIKIYVLKHTLKNALVKRSIYWLQFAVVPHMAIII